MPAIASPAQILRFGDYSVDIAAGQLRRKGALVRLPEQSFRALRILLEHAGEVVSREELCRQLWPDNVFVNFENSLNSAMARLRAALQDSSENPLFIETLPRRGYRFVGVVSWPVNDSASVWQAKIAVLPFLNLTGDPGQEYLADVLTEELITVLASLVPGKLGVIARTTMMHYKGSRLDVGEIGHELAVDYVLEGSIQGLEGKIGINAQLIRVQDQTHAWAGRYHSEIKDFFGIATSLGDEIACRIGLTTPTRTRKPTGKLEAYDRFLQGHYHLDRGTRQDTLTANRFFEAAVARDPEFALAYDALAEIQMRAALLGWVAPRDAYAKGMFYALRAIELDNTLAETHALLGQLAEQLDYNWAEVTREMAIARRLNASSPVVRLRYSISELIPLGRIPEAIAELELTVETDPLSITKRNWLAVALMLDRRYEEAMVHSRLVNELAPASYTGPWLTGMFLQAQGAYEEAVESQRKATRLGGGAPLLMGFLGMALAQGGKTREAFALIEQIRSLASRTYVLPSSLALIYLGLGDLDGAFTWLDQAIEHRDQMMRTIRTLPFFDPLRADPRFDTLLRKMSLKP